LVDNHQINIFRNKLNLTLKEKKIFCGIYLSLENNKEKNESDLKDELEKSRAEFEVAKNILKNI
jgi:hypothetical protein